MMQAETIAVVTVIAVYFAVPLFIYISLMARFFFDKNLAEQFKDIYNDEDENEDKDKNHDEVKMESPEVLLTFKNVRYSVINNKNQRINILKGCDGYFKPGTLSAIMGP